MTLWLLYEIFHFLWPKTGFSDVGSELLLSQFARSSGRTQYSTLSTQMKNRS